MNILDMIKGWLGMASAPPRAPEHLSLPERLSARPPEVENLRTASFSELDAKEIVAPPPPLNDLVKVRSEAGVDAVTQNRVARAKQLLETLPTGTPKAQKRAIVEAAFAAFDIPTAKIIQGAVDEVAALEAYIDRGEQEKDETLAKCEDRIRALEAQIASVRDEMQATREAQAERDRVARAEIATIQPILLFFADEAAAVRPSVPPAPNTRPRVGGSSMPPSLPEPTPMKLGGLAAKPSAPPLPPPPPDSDDLLEASDVETVVGPHPLSILPVPVPSTARESGKSVEGEGKAEEAKSPTIRPSRVPPPAR